VRELVGAPRPQVWEEIENEHTRKEDSNKLFSPGTNCTSTCSKEEFLTVMDPKKGKEARDIHTGRSYLTLFVKNDNLALKTAQYIM
jgi:hypothetical protein